MHKIKHFFSTLKINTPVAIIIAACILGLSHLGYGVIMANGGQVKSASLFAGKAIDQEDMVTGNTKSDVVVVEYSDTECPFCAQLHPTMKKIKDEYSSKIAFVYRYFPLTQIHPNAFDEAKAVHCVGKLLGAENRVTYIDQMFSEKINNKNMTLAKGRKEAIAKNLGVSDSDLALCLSSQDTNNIVNASIQDGINAGVQGTPATFILVKTRSGYEVVAAIDGARPYEYIKTAIDAALTY